LRANAFDLAAALLIAALLVMALLVFRDYAISNDEEVQHRYGELILAYYASGFEDLSVFQYKNLYLYGGLFDVAAIQIGRVVPVDVYVVRHVLCCVIGIGGLAATWMTARLVAGPRAGLLAVLVLAVCGPWIGGMFNHTKDVPFAAAMMAAVYFLLRAARDLPRPHLRHTLGFGLMLGAALGLRAVGLLLLLYTLVAIACRLPQPLSANTAVRFAVHSLVAFLPAFAIGYAIMIAAWPWAALDLFNPIRAGLAFAHFHYPIKTLLAGQTYLMAEVPRWYLPTYLAIKLPLAMLLGAALALTFATGLVRSPPGNEAGRRRIEIGVLALTALFPVLAQVVSHGPAFSGMRHLMFVVPPLAVLAGVGFDNTLAWLEARRRAFAVAGIVALGAGLLWPASVLLRLHPYEYLYFNALVGGLQGATGRYDTDYWVNVMHEAVVDLEGFLDREKGPHAARWYFVAVCGERVPFEKEAEARGRLRMAIGDDPADFFIASTHENCHNAIDGKVIATITRMGVPIGVVKDRRQITQPHLAGR
jgi:hypothetical protein